MSKLMLVIALFALFAGTATASECVQNFKAEGSVIAGKRYTTTVAFPQQKQAALLDKLARYLPTQGWANVSVDSARGTLSAEQGVVLGKGSKAPLSVVATEDSGTSTSLVFTFVTTGMTSARESSVRDGFCKMAGAAGG